MIRVLLAGVVGWARRWARRTAALERAVVPGAEVRPEDMPSALVRGRYALSHRLLEAFADRAVEACADGAEVVSVQPWRPLRRLIPLEPGGPDEE